MYFFTWIYCLFCLVASLPSSSSLTKSDISSGDGDKHKHVSEIRICNGYNLTEEKKQELVAKYSQFRGDGNVSSVNAKTKTIVGCDADKLRATNSIFHENGDTSGKYCIAPENGGFKEYECKEKGKCTNETPCIRKCCGENEAWDINSNSCKHLNNSSWDPSFYEVTDDGDCIVKLGVENGKRVFHSLVGLPEHCNSKQNFSTIPSRNIPGKFGKGRFRMLVNGSVMMNYDNGTWFQLPDDSFCVDEFFGSERSLETTVNVQPHRKSVVLLVCLDAFKPKGLKKPISPIYAAMLYSAALILFLVILIYLMLWDRHNVYEWTVFFEVLATICMISIVSVSHTVARDPSEGYYGSIRCILLGMASHYFFLATFFWLFVINFEIWWNFRSLTLRSKKSRKWLRLLSYHLVGWGGPFIMVMIGLTLDRYFGLSNDSIDCTSLILPNYGQLNCYISKRAQGPYLYYPIGVLLGFNLLFYVMTAYKMLQYQKNSESIKKSSGQFQPITVFARLFIVMGVCWIAEIIAWAIKPNVRGKVPLYWIVFDVVTLLQALAIFYIFIFLRRKEIGTELIAKYPKLEGFVKFCFCCCKAPDSGEGDEGQTTPSKKTTSPGRTPSPATPKNRGKIVMTTIVTTTAEAETAELPSPVQLQLHSNQPKDLKLQHRLSVQEKGEDKKEGQKRPKSWYY